MGTRQAKYGRWLSPQIAGPPNGIKELQRVITCAGCNRPLVTSPLVTRRYAVVNASHSTLPLSCSDVEFYGPVCEGCVCNPPTVPEG